MRDRTAEFHKKQLDGIDWQTAAIDLDHMIDEESEDYYMDTSSPSPECHCDTCKNTEFY